MTTYYQAPLGLGLPWITRTDLGIMPDNNDDSELIKTRELFNEGAEQKFFNALGRVFSYVPAFGGGCIQAFFILSFARKNSIDVKLIFERTDPLFHCLTIVGSPIWIGDPPPVNRPPGYVPYAMYPPYATNNAARICDTNHHTRNNMTFSLMLPWPNSLVEGQPMEALIDRVANGNNRMWILAE